MGLNTATWVLLKNVRGSVRRFWGAVPGALKNHLNSEELARITITSLTAGGGLFGLIQALSVNVESLFPASSDAALAMVVLTTVLEAFRRLGHGQESPPRSGPSHLRT